MNIYEFADKYNLSVKKVKQIAADGALNLNPGKREVPSQMRYYLKKGRTLTAEHMLMLVRNPELFDILEEYEGAARKQIRALGNIPADAIAEDQAATWIYAAMISDELMLPRVADWLAPVIPADGCGYHYVAVRMLYNVPSHRFKEAYSQVARACLSLRRCLELRGQILPQPDKSENQGMRFFRKPENIFDL